MIETAKRVTTRAGGLLLVICLFAALTLPFTSDTVIQWIARVSVVTVLAAAAWWSARDAHRLDVNTGSRDWLVVSFLVGVGWWVVQTWLEGERDIIDRMGLDFVSVLVTIALVFAAAVVGMVIGRGQARADGVS